MENSAKKRNFYSILQGDVERRLRIPQAFLKHLQNEISETATLVGPNGQTWHAKVRRTTDEMFLEDGWDLFTKDHSLVEGELVVLRYDGNMIFNVKLFDTNTCEREDAVTITANSQGSEQNGTPPTVDRKKRGRPQKVVGKKRGRPPKVENRQSKTCPEPKESTKYSKDESCGGTPKDFGEKKRGRPRKTAFETNPQSTSLEESASYGRDESWGGSQKDLGRKKRGRPRKTALETNPQSTALEGNKAPSTELDTPERKEGREANATAASFTSPFPSFTVKFEKINVKFPYFMPIPPSFVRYYLPPVSQELFLLDSNGKKSPVQYVYGNHVSGLVVGWAEFCSSNNLEVDDECVFELTEPNQFRIHIFRSESSTTDQNL